MDGAQHYRAQAVELCMIADSATDETLRKSLLKNSASCEQMADALDVIATGVRLCAKHPDILSAITF